MLPTTIPSPLFSNDGAAFDGALGSALVLDHQTGLEIAQGSLALSFNLNALSFRQGLFSKDSAGNDDGGHFAVLAEGAGLRVRLQDDANSTFEIEIPDVLQVGVDHDLVVTFGAGGMQLWLDGALIGTNAYTGGLTGNKEPIVLGANQWLSGDLVADNLRDALDGEITSVQIFDEALTEAQIVALAEGETPPAEEPPVEQPINTAPTAEDDTAATEAETDVTIDLLSNDSDLEGGLVLQSLGEASGGTVTDNGDGTVTYTPNPGFSGQDSFDYTVVDAGGLTATATATVTVAPTSDEPSVEPPSSGSAPNAVFSAEPAVYDGSTTSATIIAHQADMELAEGSIALTACFDALPFRQGLFSKDSAGNDDGGHVAILTEGAGLRIRLQDDAKGTFEINVPNVLQTGVDHAIVLNFGAGGMELWLDGVLIGTNDYTGGLTGNQEPIVLGANQWTSGNLVADDLRDAFNGEIKAASIFGARLNEAQIAALAHGEDITVPAPTPADDNAVVDEDGSILIDVLGNDTDPSGEALSLGAVGQASNGTVTIEDGQIRYTPNADFAGADSFTYTVRNASGSESSATVAVTVNAANDAPVAVDDEMTARAGRSTTLDLLANDSDVDGAFSIQSVGQPANGVATLNEDGSVDYTPNAEFLGTDSFSYTIVDEAGATATATATVTVVANQAPTAQDDEAATELNAPVTIDLLANDADLEGPVTVQSLGEAANGTVTDNGDGTVTYTPDAEFIGQDSFSYTIVDADGLTATATATVEVQEASGPQPVFIAQAATFDGTIGSAVVIEDPANLELPQGAIALKVCFDALPGRQGIFTKDSSGNDDGGHVAILAEGAGLRIRLQDDTSQTFEINAVNVLKTGVDHTIVLTFGPGGMELWLDGALVGTNAYAGGLVGNKEPIVLGANQWTSGDLVADNLRDAMDGEIKSVAVYGQKLNGEQIAAIAGGQPPAAGGNTAPTAVDDAASTEAESAVTLDLLANDSDLEGPVTIQSIAGAANGSVIDNGDGTATYTPNAGFIGADSFEYTIVDSDGLTATATATVTVTVTEATEAPGEGPGEQPVEDPGEAPAPTGPVGPPQLFANNGASFNGTVDAAIVAGHQPNLEIAEGSVEFILDLYDFTPRMGILTKDASGFGAGGHLGFFVEGESLTVRLQDGVTTHKIFALDVLSLNAEHHVLFNFGSNGMELWLDGELIRTNDYTGGLIGNKEPIVIGANQWHSDPEQANDLLEPLNGAVRNVSFYGRNISEDEVPAMLEQAKSREPAQPAPEPIPDAIVNGAPEATDDFYQIGQDNSLETDAVGGVLGNDLDSNDDTLTASLVEGSLTEGELTFNADGSFSFDGGADFDGSASFQYEVTDGTETAIATATITTAAPANRAVQLREIIINEVRSDAQIGDVVGELIGFDPDLDEITYDLLSGTAFDYFDVDGDKIVVKASVEDLGGQVLTASFGASDGLTQDFGGGEFEIFTPGQVTGEATILLTYGQSLANSFRSFERISEDPAVADKLLEVSQDDGAAFLRQLDPGSAERTSYAIMHRIAHEFDAAGQDIPTLLSVEAPRDGASLAELVVDPSKGFASVEDGLLGTESGELFYVRNVDGSVEYYGNRNGRASGTGRDEEPQFGELVAQLERAKAALDASGGDAADVIYMNFQQGQSDDKGSVGGQAYNDVLQDFLARIEAEATRIFEKPIKIEMFLGQTRSYGGDVAYEHFKAVVEDENIHFGATEFNYQAEFPARREIDGSISENSNDAVHLNSIGYNLIGQQIGKNIFEFMTGQAAHTDPIYVSSVFVDGATVTLTFANVEGQLADDPSIWHEASRVGAPEHFGVAFIADGATEAEPLEILSSAITGRAELTFELAAPLAGETTVIVGSNFDENETFHGTTLRDSEGFSADIYTDPTLVDDETIYEFIGRQRATIDENGLISTEFLDAADRDITELVGEDAGADVLALAGEVTVALGLGGDDRFEHQNGDSIVDGGEGFDSFVAEAGSQVSLVDGTLGDGGVAEISVVKGGVSTTHYLYNIEQVLLDDQVIFDDGGVL